MVDNEFVGGFIGDLLVGLLVVVTEGLNNSSTSQQ